MRRSILALAALAASCLLTWPAAAAPKLVVKVPAGARLPSTSSVEVARQFLESQAKLPAHVVLVPERTVSLQRTTIHRFVQKHLGVPVYARGGGIAVDDHGRVVLATSHTEQNLPSTVIPAIDAATAAVIATDFARAPAAHGHARLMIVPGAREARLAWMVWAPAMLPEPYAPVTTIDAQTGKVLASVNAARFKNAAKVYLTNPVEDNGVTSTAILPVSDPNTTPDNADIASFNCVDNGTVKEFQTSKGIRYVHMCDLEKNAVAEPNTGDFTQYEPAADDVWGDPFAEVQIFYHANKAFDFFRSFEGHADFKLATSDTPLSVVANWLQNPRGIRVTDGGVDGGLEAGVDAGDLAAAQPLTPYQNAAYIPYVPGASGPYDLTTVYPDQIKGGVLQFGQGIGADYAYDGQVIYHEFTHAVVGATIDLVPYWHMDSQGATPSPGSLNEALADFFSGAISGKAKLGTYAVKDMQAVGLPSKDCIRDLGSQNTCKDMAGEVHFDSIFFSSALWKVRESLADDAKKKAFTAAMFTVMHTASGDIGYEELAEAFVTTLGNTMDQATAKAMSDELTVRGVLPECNRIVEYQGKPLRSSAVDMSNTFVSIGPMYFQNLSLDYAPSFFQVKVPVAPGTTSLKTTFRAIAGGWGGSQFEPQFLVSYGAPIAFDEANKFTPNTTTLFDATTPTADGGTSEAGVTDAGPSSSDEVKNYSATIDVPAGTTEAYVMLVNKGQAEAYFLDLAFTQDGVFEDAGPDAEQEAAAETGAAGSVSAPDAEVDSGTPEGQPATTTPEADDGCGCRVPRSTSGTGALAIGLAAAALLLRRRRSS